MSGRCCAVEFNSTYPIQLEGIIEQTEFEESIQNINQTITQRDSLIMIDLLPEICLLIGLILIIAGVIIFMFFILPIVLLFIALACCIFVLGLILMIFGYYMIHGDLSEQMQQAITRESTKYSTRTPTPCTWRLHLRRMNAGNLENYGVSNILSSRKSSIPILDYHRHWMSDHSTSSQSISSSTATSLISSSGK